MKKILAFILIAAMVTAMSATAFAARVDQNTSEKTGSTSVFYRVDPSYMVTIPADVSVKFNAIETDFGSIEVTTAQLHADKCIKVALNTDGKMEHVTDPSKSIPYVIKAGDGAFTSGTYLAAGDKTELTIEISQDAWNKAQAGSYSDTVTFTVSYENLTSN